MKTYQKLMVLTLVCCSLMFILLVSLGLAQTEEEVHGPVNLALPWKADDVWRFTGGPHHHMGGQTNYDRPWSGLDFVPTEYDGENNIVRAIYGGTVERVIPNCEVVIRHNDSDARWLSRYLHVNAISVTEKLSVTQGQPIALISSNQYDTCYLEDPGESPHLHLDLMMNNVETYVDFENHHIGGYLIQDSTETDANGNLIGVYDGPLVRDGISLEPQSGGEIYIKNEGWVGEGSYFDSGTKVISATKDLGSSIESVVLCALNGGCQRVYATGFHNIRIEDPMLSNLKVIMPTLSRHIDFIGKDEIGNLTACVDFDIQDLRDYVFPETQFGVRENSKIAYLRKGKCASPLAEFSGNYEDEFYPLQPKDFHGCEKQQEGVYFTNDYGYCLFGYSFHHRGISYSMPFNPNRITVKGSVPYHVQIHGSKNDCQAFSVGADSSVTLNLSLVLPVKRVEVFPWSNENGCVLEYSSDGWPDIPALAYISAHYKVMTPPLLVWFVTAKPDVGKLSVEIYSSDEHGSVIGDSYIFTSTTTQLYAPWGTSGEQLVSMMVTNENGGGISAGISYYVVEDPLDPYVGFSPWFQKFVSQFVDIFEFEVPSGQFAYISGKSITINGVNYETQSLTGKSSVISAISLQVVNRLYKLPIGKYVISNWNDGSLVVGEDNKGGYLEYLVNEKEVLTGEDWEGVELNDLPVFTPTLTPISISTPINTLTPTSTSMPTQTSTPSPSVTVIATTRPTETPFIEATETSTLPIATNTATPTPTVVSIITTTPVVIPTKESEDENQIFLPLIAR